MIYLDSVAVQATQRIADTGEEVYNAENLTQWIVRSWTGVGSLTAELVQGARSGTILQRYMCRLTLAYLTGEGVDRAWSEFVNVMDAIHTVDAEGNCPICFESMDEGARLTCGHVFHELCVSRWFMETTTCPMCRYDITS